jgi:hypothetical protein
MFQTNNYGPGSKRNVRINPFLDQSQINTHIRNENLTGLKQACAFYNHFTGIHPLYTACRQYNDLLHSKENHNSMGFLMQRAKLFEIVETFCEAYKIKIDINADQHRVFNEVCKRGDLTLIRYICETFENIDINKDLGPPRNTVLISTLNSREKAIIEYLCIRFKDKVNITGLVNNRTLFYHISDDGDTLLTVYEIFRDKFDINRRLDKGKRLIHFFYRLDIKYLKIFCDRYGPLIDINARDDDQRTILCHRKRSQCFGIAVYIFPPVYMDQRDSEGIEKFKYICDKFKHTIDVNMTVEEGGTLLHSLCEKEHFELMEYFIKKFKNKIDINIKDNKGESVLSLACKMGLYEYVKYIHQTFRSTIDIDG